MWWTTERGGQQNVVDNWTRWTTERGVRGERGEEEDPGGPIERDHDECKEDWKGHLEPEEDLWYIQAAEL